MVNLPPVGLQSIVISMYVCVYMCLLTYLKNDMTRLHEVFCAC